MPFIVRSLHAPIRQKAFLFLMQSLGYTQQHAQRLIAKGRLSVQGNTMSNQAGYVEGACELICFEPISRGLEPIFTTPDWAIYDKPSGLIVHPQNRHSPYTLTDEIKHRFGDEANITHRIDQETSGLILAARHKSAERLLKMMFEEREVSKHYRAMVRGELIGSHEVRAPLLRREDPSALVRMIVRVDPQGKPSHTSIRPIRYFPTLDATLVEASPHTGRQHQIRVHLAHLGHPIIGDPIYSISQADAVRFLDKEMEDAQRHHLTGASRLLLHAYSLRFVYGAHHYHIVSQEDFLRCARESIGSN